MDADRKVLRERGNRPSHLIYVLRPPIVQDRLSWTSDGHVRYSFRRAFRDGSTGIVLTPHTLIERLAALVPRPHKNLTTYHSGPLPCFAR